MKQHITIEQLNELSKKGRKNLEAWHLITYSEYMNPNDGDIKLLSIGQMIEYLEEHTKDVEYFSIRMGRAASDGFAFPRGTLITHMDGVGIEIEDEPDLCEALWQAVREDLEK